jgi:mersacidin/lichenicidin family type 2 lantibiotic
MPQQLFMKKRKQERKVQIIMRIDIVRAWKDEAYRASLSQEEQTLLPENPVGALELSDAELEAVHGAHHHHGGSHNGNKTYVSFAVTCTQSAAGACFSFGGECFE